MRYTSALCFAGTALAACNGHDELCGRKYSDVVDVGSHDSAFVGYLPTENQYTSVQKQLGGGARFLQAQTHDKDGTIEMCHTYCWEEDSGPLSDFLSPISDFLDSNPNEVLTLLLTNGDAISVNDFDKDFDNAGLKKYVFTPDGVLGKDDWPTLQQMIDDGTRLVVFMDYNMDQSAVPYIINEFDYFWETSYEVTDSDFPSCAVDRPDNADTGKLMGLVNHMLHVEEFGIQIPDSGDAGTTNSVDSITGQVQECVDAYGEKPKVVLLDYISVGDARDARNQLNGL